MFFQGARCDFHAAVGMSIMQGFKRVDIEGDSRSSVRLLDSEGPLPITHSWGRIASLDGCMPVPG